MMSNTKKDFRITENYHLTNHFLYAITNHEKRERESHERPSLL